MVSIKNWMVAFGAFGLMGCSAHLPTRFADAPPAQRVADDAPIPIPAHLEPLEPVRWSDVYLRRPLVLALSPVRSPRAGDVNAWDEVPHSSWFQPLDEAALEEAWLGSGPPVPPLRLIRGRPRASHQGLRAIDARGVGYELEVDPRGVPNSVTAAGPIAARLVRALGYLTPPAHRVALSRDDFEPDARLERLFAPGVDRRIALATEWPSGVDVGLTPPRGMRPDDPNDQIAHEHRRTLRALVAIASWLDIPSMGAQSTRDVYVGAAPSGHLRHFVVHLSEGLGAGRLTHGAPLETAAGLITTSPWRSLVTLGLSGRDRPPQSGDLTLLSASPQVRGFVTSTPYEPFDELLPADVYWALKRIAALSPRTLTAAMAAGGGDEVEQRRLAAALRDRAEQLLAVSLTLISPIEYEALLGDQLIIHDFAAYRFGQPPVPIEVRLYDGSGRELSRGTLSAAPRSALTIPRPIGVGYLVVELRSKRQPPPRPTELHIQLTPSPRLVGILR